MRYGKFLVAAICAVFVGQVFLFNPVFAADLCQGLITDKLNHPMTALAKPGLLQTAIDPQFGTTIRRISNAGTNHVVKPMYSTMCYQQQAFSTWKFSSNPAEKILAMPLII